MRPSGLLPRYTHCSPGANGSGVLWAAPGAVRIASAEAACRMGRIGRMGLSLNGLQPRWERAAVADARSVETAVSGIHRPPRRETQKSRRVNRREASSRGTVVHATSEAVVRAI